MSVKVSLYAGEKGNRLQRLLRFWDKMSDLSTSYLCQHIRGSKKQGWAAVLDGSKSFFKETICEDAPLTADLYQLGKSEGKRDGYATASKLLGKEIRKLGKELVQLKHDGKMFSKKQKADYERVIKAYDEALQRMTEKCDKTKSENQYLKELLRERKALDRIRIRRMSAPKEKKR